MTQFEAPADITVFTLPWCPHCARAKALLRRRGLSFREIDGTAVADFRSQMAARTGGFTVPQVVIDGEPVGGAAQLASLDRLGVLAAIAAGEQFPITREVRRISPRSVVRWAAAWVRGRHDVSALQRVRVRIDRAGRVLDTDHALIPKALEEEQDGEGMRGTSG